METTESSLTEFLDECEASLSTGTLPLRVFNDEQLHDRELERIFTRAWVFVGHESEIPARGDYAQRRIGRDPFVLVRGDDGEIRVLFDTCRHRGAMVCRAERGNAALFRCPYHGWTYKNTGELAGAPFLRDAYGSDLKKSEWGLFRAPKVESLHGLIFASLDPDAPSLADYLGDMKWYLDMIWGQCADGWEVVGDPERYLVRANWKTAAENFTGDDYHTFYLHRSTIETGIMDGIKRGDALENLDAYHVQAGNGHAISRFMIPSEVPGPRFWGYPPEVAALFTPEKLGEEMYEAAKLTIGSVGTVFPNLSFAAFPFRHRRESGPVPTMVLHSFEPRSSEEMVIWSWAICPKGAPEAFRRETARTTIGVLGAGGTVQQDDTEPWMSMARAAGTTYGHKLGMRLNYEMGLSGEGASKLADDYRGPGVAFYPALEEGVMRGFHRRWVQFMRDGGYPAAMTPEEQNAGAGGNGHG